MYGTDQVAHQKSRRVSLMESGKNRTTNYFATVIQKHGLFATFVLVGTLFWTIWNESFAPGALIVGTVLSWLSLSITNRYLLRNRYQELFRIQPLRLLRYIGVLILAIFESGVHAMYITVTGRIDVHIVDLPTKLQNPFHGVLVANAITLTPGTVTIDYQPGVFKVIWIESVAHNIEEASDMIKGRFEKVLEPTQE